MGMNSGQWVVVYGTGNSSGTRYVNDKESAEVVAGTLKGKGNEVKIMPASEYKSSVHRWWQ